MSETTYLPRERKQDSRGRWCLSPKAAARFMREQITDFSESTLYRSDLERVELEGYHGQTTTFFLEDELLVKRDGIMAARQAAKEGKVAELVAKPGYQLLAPDGKEPKGLRMRMHRLRKAGLLDVTQGEGLDKNGRPCRARSLWSEADLQEAMKPDKQPDEVSIEEVRALWILKTESVARQWVKRRGIKPRREGTYLNAAGKLAHGNLFDRAEIEHERACLLAIRKLKAKLKRKLNVEEVRKIRADLAPKAEPAPAPSAGSAPAKKAGGNVAEAIRLVLDDHKRFRSVPDVAKAVPCGRAQLYNSPKFMAVWNASKHSLPARGSKSRDGRLEAYSE